MNTQNIEYIIEQSQNGECSKQNNKKIECLHLKCSECNGTGFKKNGLGTCVHMISCPCKNCNCSFM